MPSSNPKYIYAVERASYWEDRPYTHKPRFPLPQAQPLGAQGGKIALPHEFLTHLLFLGLFVTQRKSIVVP